MIVARILALLLATAMCSAVPFKRLVDGIEVEKFESQPWMAWLVRGRERLQCGAVLVAGDWVVTAASCISSQITAVVVGDHDRTVPEGREQQVGIAAVVLHSGYDPITFENDIALIQLEQPVAFGKGVQPIPFMISEGVDLETVYTKRCRIAGWGQPEACGGGAALSNPLEEVVVDRVDDQSCMELAGERPDSVLCFRRYRRPELSSVCSTDVGGPFICKIQTQWHLLGVISGWQADEACSPSLKGATKLAQYVDWIASHIGPQPTTSGTITESFLGITNEPVTFDGTTVKRAVAEADIFTKAYRANTPPSVTQTQTFIELTTKPLPTPIIEPPTDAPTEPPIKPSPEPNPRVVVEPITRPPPPETTTRRPTTLPDSPILDISVI